MRRFLFAALPAVLILIVLAGCAAGQTGGSTAPAATQPPDTATFAPTAEIPTSEVPATGAETTNEAATETPTQPTAEQPSPAAAGLHFALSPEQSEARYRVREQLVNVSLPNDAVGATNQVTGAVVINSDGTVDPAASRFEVDMASLRSDSDRRDNFVRRNVLQTDQFPKAVFVPTRVEGLTFPLADSGQFAFKLIGDLTIRDVTQEVAWDVTGTLENGQAQGQARTEFTFATFNLTQPRVPVVLSIEDRIILELDGVFTRVGETAAATVDPAAAGAVPVTAPNCAAPAELTPAMTEGPYYKAGAPERTSLVEPGMPGTRVLLTGFVLTTDCQPIPNAVVDFWQTDALGNYDNAGFGMRGQQRTDANGMYRLETVLPGEYPGRTAHIHVKVQAPDGPVLTSQLFIPGVAQNQTDRIFDQRLLVNVLSEGDPLQAAFNFVVP